MGSQDPPKIVRSLMLVLRFEMLCTENILFLIIGIIYLDYLYLGSYWHKSSVCNSQDSNDLYKTGK